VQRRHAQVIGDVRVRPGANQQIGNHRIVSMYGPVERRRTVALRRVDVEACRVLFQQRADRLEIAVLDGLDEPLVAARRGTHAAQRQDDEQDASADCRC